MKKETIASLLLVAALALGGCSGGDAPEEGPSTTPTPTPTPLVTMEPTQAPELQEVDPSLPTLGDVLMLAPEEWPENCKMRYLHASGNVVEATGRLARGEDYALYLLEGLPEKSFGRFVLEEGRVEPERSPLLDTGEGITIAASEAAVSAALDAAVSQSEEEGYFLSARHGIDEWPDMYGFSLEPERGSVPYAGEFAILEDGDRNVRRILSLDAAGKTRLVTLQVYESIAEPTMFQYLCSMLASLRFT